MKSFNPHPIDEIINNIENGTYDKVLEDIYFHGRIGQSGVSLDYQKTRYVKALQAFENEFGKEKVSIFSAPGRTEIGGNHTDHQHGQVIAASVNLDMIAVVAKRQDDIIKIVSKGHDTVELSAKDIDWNIPSGTSASLVMGMLEGFVSRNYAVGGFNAYITSDVPSGLGLSSSAAYETLIGTILSGIYNDMNISPVEIGVIGQYAENVFFGKPCGLMDQLACSVGGLIHIDFANPDNPKVEKIGREGQVEKVDEAPRQGKVNKVEEACEQGKSDNIIKEGFDFSRHGYHICIVDTGASHENMTDEYAAIPGEMKAVAEYFGKEVLRDVAIEDVVENMKEIRARFGDRSLLRTMHFLGENERVGKQVGYLKKDDIKGFLEMVKASGDSSYKYLQNVYSSSNICKQEISVALCMSEMLLNGRGVVRVHGGGFAGTIQAFVRSEISEYYKEQMNAMYKKDACQIVSIREQGGVRVI